MRARHGLWLMANGIWKMVNGDGSWFRPLTIAISHLPLAMAVACTSGGPASKPTARNLVVITIDTLRADHVGAYGYTRARTPNLDALGRGGVLFDRAYAAAPITLPSHATLMSGLYPPGHGSRDNGLRVSPGVPTLATALQARGFRTGAFVAAFPLDHQFGLNRGFDVYGDHIPRGPDGRLANERPASQVVDEAIAWLRHLIPTPQSHQSPRPNPHQSPIPNPQSLSSYGSISSSRTRLMATPHVEARSGSLRR